MKIIALTGALESTLHAAAKQLLRASVTGNLQLSVLVNIKDAAEAQAVYCDHGELWRIGHDDGKPELDALVDRTVDDGTPEDLQRNLDAALQRFLGKVAVAS